MRTRPIVASFQLVPALLCITAPAQTLKGTIIGEVSDASGAVVPGVQVTALHVPTNTSFTAVSNDRGLYEISALNIGEYRVSAEIAGFKKATVANVILTVGQKERVDIKLQVGEIASIMEVTAKTPLLHTDEGTISKQLSAKEVRELPLLGRDITQLQLLAPGTASGYAGGGNLGIGLNTRWSTAIGVLSGDPVQSQSTEHV